MGRWWRRKIVKNFLNDEDATYFPKAEKVLVPAQAKFENSNLHSAYKFDIYSKIHIKEKMFMLMLQVAKYFFIIKTL